MPYTPGNRPIAIRLLSGSLAVALTCTINPAAALADALADDIQDANHAHALPQVDANGNTRALVYDVQAVADALAAQRAASTSSGTNGATRAQGASGEVSLDQTDTATGVAASQQDLASNTTDVPLMLSASQAAAQDRVFLSDLSPASKTVGGGTSLGIDRSPSGGIISLHVNGKLTTFGKGLGTHANSDLVYNIAGLGFKRFYSYIGIDNAKYNAPANEADGVIFRVYTRASQDAEWTCVYNSEGGVQKNNADAAYVDVDISGAAQLRLVVDKNKSDWHDHAVWAGAKLAKDTYIDTLPQEQDFIKPLATYDQQIAARHSAQEWTELFAQDKVSQEDELLILQRALVNRVGYDALQAFAGSDSAYAASVRTLMTDVDFLRHYITGGAALSNEMAAIRIMDRLLEAHGADVAPGAPDRDVYMRMMCATALTHSGGVAYWTGKQVTSDPVTRYEIIKTLRAHADQYKFRTDIFDSLPVETMRWVMDNKIEDVHIPWLVNYTLSKYPNNEGKRLDSYTYIAYTSNFTSNGGYNNQAFYQPQNFDGPMFDLDGKEWTGGWNQKYQLRYSDPNFPNDPGDPFEMPYGETNRHAPWIVFEKGGVCGSLAKTYSNLDGIVGIPSAVVGQPGHAATFKYDTVQWKGKTVGTWSIQNNISGWRQTEKGERLLNGWGVKNKSKYAYNGSYMQLGQAALNDIDAYERSQEARLTLKSFSDDASQEQALYDVGDIQGVNWDVWEDLFNLLAARGASPQEWTQLATRIAEGLAFYPLPMNDFLQRIQDQVKDDLQATISINEIRVAALERAKVATNDDTVQDGVCRDIASMLLGQPSSAIATFSFTGDQANTIILGTQFTGNVAWKYSIDGGKSWTEVYSERERKLTEEEINTINAEDDLKIQFIGSQTVHTIDLTEATAPTGFWVNQFEHTLHHINWTNNEVSVNGGPWQTIEQATPFTGTCTVELRAKGGGTQKPSSSTTIEFVDSNTAERRYIPKDEYEVESYSSQQDAGNNAAANVRDGDGYTFWHTKFNGADEKWIILDYQTDRTFVELGFLPRQDGEKNGVPKSLEISVAQANAEGGIDESSWQVVATSAFDVNTWMGADGKQEKFITFNTPTRGRFIKVRETSNNQWLSAAQIDAFESRRGDVALTMNDASTVAFNGEVPTAQSFGIQATRDGVDATSEVSFSWASVTSGELSYTDGLPVNAGSYRIKATLPATEQGGMTYEERTVEGTLEITPAPVSVSVTGTNDVVVGGVEPLSAWYVDVTGEKRAATVLYNGQDLSDDEVRGLQAGVYAISARIEDKNYQKSSVTGIDFLTVREPQPAQEPGTIEVNPPAANPVFDENALTAAKLGVQARRGTTDATSELQWRYAPLAGAGSADVSNAELSWREGLPANAGSYVIEVYLPEAKLNDVIYTAARRSFTAVIDPAEVAVTLVGSTEQRVGEIEPLHARYTTVGGEFADAVVLYNGQELSDEQVRDLQAGSYALSVQIADQNYALGSLEGSSELIVLPRKTADPVIEVHEPDHDMVFDGGAPTAQAMGLVVMRGGKDASADLTYEHRLVSDDARSRRAADTEWVEGLPTEAGTYEVHAVLAAAVIDNISYSAVDTTFTVSIAPRKVEVEITGSASQMEGSVAPLEAVFTDVDGALRTAAVLYDGQELSAEDVSQLGAGTYELSVRIDDPNYVMETLHGVTKLEVSKKAPQPGDNTGGNTDDNSGNTSGNTGDNSGNAGDGSTGGTTNNGGASGNGTGESGSHGAGSSAGGVKGSQSTQNDPASQTQSGTNAAAGVAQTVETPAAENTGDQTVNSAAPAKASEEKASSSSDAQRKATADTTAYEPIDELPSGLMSPKAMTLAVVGIVAITACAAAVLMKRMR